jgi:uncharacterized membrane protein
MALSHDLERDPRMERLVGNLLRAGVLTAASVVLVGGALYLHRHGRSDVGLKEFVGEPSELRYPGRIVADAFALKSRAIIQFGLLLLIATPVARVGLLMILFARQRDRLYFGVSLLVLAVLVYSLLSGNF